MRMLFAVSSDNGQINELVRPNGDLDISPGL